MLSHQFGAYFKSLERDENGVAEFRQPWGKLNLVFRQSYPAEAAFTLNILLDIVRQTADGHETVHLPLLDYAEVGDEVSYEPHENEVFPNHFFSEQTLLVPALVRQAAERAEYITSLREGQTDV